MCISTAARNPKNTGGCFGNRLAFNIRPDFQTWAALLYDMGEGRFIVVSMACALVKRTNSMPALNIFTATTIFHAALTRWAAALSIHRRKQLSQKYFETADTLTTELSIPINERTSAEIHIEYDSRTIALPSIPIGLPGSCIAGRWCWG